MLKKVILIGLIGLLFLMGGLGTIGCGQKVALPPPPEKVGEPEVTPHKEPVIPEEPKARVTEGRIAFVSSAGNIHLINPDGTNEVRLST